MEKRSRKTIALSRLISASIAVSIIASLGGPLVTSFAADPAKRVPRSVDVIPRPTDLRMGLAQVQYKGYFADNTNWFTNERYSSSVMGDITTSTSGLPVFDGSSDLGGKTSFSWTGYFIPDFTGEWQFQISSDDASYLWIGNDAIVNYQSNPGSALIRNGGIHTERLVAAKIYLIKDKIYPLRIQYGNDANAAAAGEQQYGCAKGMKDFITITLGTGAGSGIFIDGKIVLGHDGFAGELGHTIIRPGGRLHKGTGIRGTLESYASATGVRETALEMLELHPTIDSALRLIPAAELTSEKVYDCAIQGDKIALEIFQFTGQLLGEALANFVMFSSPEAIVLFGGLTKAGDLILNPTQEAMEANLCQVFKNKVKLVFSNLKEADAAILGASALIWEV